MKHWIAILTALTLAVACAPKQEAAESDEVAAPDVIVTGMVTEIGGHGNGYTNLRNASLDSAGIGPGDVITLDFTDTKLTFTVGTGYGDVSNGQNVAVLHREGTVVLAVNNGDFFRLYGKQPGAEFRVIRAPSE